MKIGHWILSAALAVSACSVTAFGEAKKDPKEADLPKCCAKAKAEGKECTHECCVAAKSAGKVCEKCGEKKPAK